MQGTAADIIKRAMIQVDAFLTREHPETTMVMQVHDELVFEIPGDRVEEVGERIRAYMVEAAELDVPLEVELGVGDNWDEAH
jgi:DNA polymerase-1